MTPEIRRHPDATPTADEAIAELRTIRSRDPAARAAMHAVTLARITLESLWRPDPPPDDR